MEAGKAEALLRVVPGAWLIDWHATGPLDGLQRNSFGMGKSFADSVRAVRAVDFARPVALVPGLTFDGVGCRLGYGGGFYATSWLLSRNDGGPIPRVQIVDHLAGQELPDVPASLVVAERDLWSSCLGKSRSWRGSRTCPQRRRGRSAGYALRSGTGVPDDSRGDRAG